MNIFNYLMNKKGHEIFNNDDILSYLLKKGRVHRATGTEITIRNAKGFNSLEMTKLSTQDGTPTPSSPVEVKTVKGYRNLYDFVNGNYTNGNNATSSRTNGTYTVNSANAYSCVRFYQSNLQLKPNTKYTFRAKIVSTTASEGSSVYASPEMNSQGSNLYGNKATAGNISYVTFTTPSTFDNNSLLGIYPREASTTAVFTDIMLVEGELKPYIPYGTNWIYTTISDGTNSKIITIPLNNNEIAGIGTYLDELIIDKNGHCWLNKKIDKTTLNGTETIAVNNTGASNWYYVIVKSIENFVAGQGMSSHYSYVAISNSNTVQGFSMVGSPKSIRIRYGTEDTPTNFKQWLSNNNVEIYFVLETPQLIDLNYTVDLTLYEGTNNITNSENMDMVLEYYK